MAFEGTLERSCDTPPAANALSAYSQARYGFG
jgi:hypothetical protein